MTWVSNAKWPDGFLEEGDTTTESHPTEGQANAACEVLTRTGFAGEGVVFPELTWVSMRFQGRVDTTKECACFEDWFDLLQMNLTDSGITFSDMASVRAEYESGRSMFDVRDELKQKYS